MELNIVLNTLLVGTVKDLQQNFIREVEKKTPMVLMIKVSDRHVDESIGM